MVARIRTARRNLSDYPHIGSPGLIQDTRRLVVGANVLTLRSRNGIVQIIAIRHGRQGDAYAPSGPGKGT